MLITTQSNPISRIIYKTEGHGKNEDKRPLFTFLIDKQPIIFDVVNGALIDNKIIIKVGKHDNSGSELVYSSGEWSLDTFNEFVEGIKLVSGLAKPYIKNDPTVVAEAKITDDTYIWTYFVNEKVAGGVFSKEQFDFFQKVDFRILGINANSIRWENEMFKPIFEMLDEFLNQREDFEKKMLERKSIKKSQNTNLSNDSAINNKDNVAGEDTLDFCYHCGFELKKKVKTCPKCGKKL
jgi:hypothetical protein